MVLCGRAWRFPHDTTVLGQWDGNLGTSRLSLQAWPELFEDPDAQLWAPSCLVGRLWEEELPASLHGVLRGDHAMADSPGVRVDLKVIPALRSEEGERRHGLR